MSALSDQYKIGYKQREKICDALRTRANAIHTALNEYNAAAAAIIPQGRHIDFMDALELADNRGFEVLNLSGSDLNSKPWMSGPRRQAGTLRCRVQRAKEEIHRLNIEIPRLITFMLDEYRICHHSAALAESAHFSSELLRHASEAELTSTFIARTLKKTSLLPGFSGSLFPGQYEDGEDVDWATESLPKWAKMELGYVQMSVPEPDADVDSGDEISEAGSDSSALFEMMERELLI